MKINFYGTRVGGCVCVCMCGWVGCVCVWLCLDVHTGWGNVIPKKSSQLYKSTFCWREFIWKLSSFFNSVRFILHSHTHMHTQSHTHTHTHRQYKVHSTHIHKHTMAMTGAVSSPPPPILLFFLPSCRQIWALANLRVIFFQAKTTFETKRKPPAPSSADSIECVSAA